MRYADGRRILDADAHIMEPPGWLESYVAPAICDELPPMDFGDPAFVSKIERSIDGGGRSRWAASTTGASSRTSAATPLV